VPAALAALAAQRGVRYAEPNYVVQAEQAPNDPRYGEQWGLHNTGQTVGFGAGTPGADVDAERAWGVTTGSRGVVVGILDTGIDYGHPDLAATVWSNPGGVWGCAAGTHGHNAFTGMCDPMDDHDHGTHVAGILGAAGSNGVGVTGVNWASSLMGLKMLDAAGNGNSVTFMAAVDRAIEAKQAGVNVRVLNASIGNAPYSQAIQDDLLRARNEHGILFVTAAGNASFLFGTNNDAAPNYPCNYAGVVCVAATNASDGLAYFSNYGAASVDLGAPGDTILSTVRGGGYAYKSGTSQATPHVAGAAALVLAAFPQLGVDQLVSTLFNGVDPAPGLAGKVVTGGRLNVYRSLLAAGAAPAATPTVGPSASATPPPTETPQTPSPTATWTATATATATPVSSRTPSPTASPTRTATATSGAGGGGKATKTPAPTRTPRR
jgi:subtilisin family serine protease